MRRPEFWRVLELIMIDEELKALHRELGIPGNYGQDPHLPVYEQAAALEEVGENLVGRMQSLTPRAALAWKGMVRAAAADSVILLIVSGYRSYEYQSGLLRNKLERGQRLDDILKVSAAPGFSQHHSGLAVDVASPGSRPLTEEFEQSEAFAWLQVHAADHSFSMTYPRDNRFGFIFEPWHWSL